jgi:hypothetical protein
VVVGSVKCCCLPEERRELARAGDRDDAGGLAAAVAEVLPALVESSLCSPSDSDDTRILALLTLAERLTDERVVAVVVRPRRGAGGRAESRPW